MKEEYIGIIDLETTGLNPKEDKITEVGISLWDMELKNPMMMYGGLTDPVIPISAEASAVSGITDDMVKGKKLDLPLIRRMAKQAKYLIAHNAFFDMSFTINEFGGKENIFAPKKWLDSMTLIDWKRRYPDVTCRKINHMAADILGIVNSLAHRALPDTLLLGRMISEDMLDEMIEKGSCRWAQIQALNTPYSSKVLAELKAEGYRAYYYNNKFQYWYKNVPDINSNVEAQLHYLGDHVYPKQMMLSYERTAMLSAGDDSKPIDYEHPATVKYFDSWYHVAAKMQKEGL